jgi:hypothetical protein
MERSSSMAIGEARRLLAVVSLPGRRAALKVVEKLLTDSMLALLEGA